MPALASPADKTFQQGFRVPGKGVSAQRGDRRAPWPQDAKWLAANAARLAVDPAHIIVAGESGGGNLTLATGLELKQDGDLGLVRGL
jgi:predicted esterase